MPYKSNKEAAQAATNGEVIVDAAEIEQQRKRDVLKRVKLVRERLVQNRGAVIDGDPSKHYIWVNRAESRQNWFVGLGYVVCRTKQLSDTDSQIATSEKKRKLEVELERKGLSKEGIEREVGKVKVVREWPSTSWKKEDGTHQRGDLILYEIDKDEYEALQLLDEARGLEAVEAPKEQFKDFLKGIRLPDGRSVPVHEPAR